MAAKTFEEYLADAANERGLDPELVLEVVAHAKELEAEAHREATRETLHKTGATAKKLGLGILGAAKGAVKGAAAGVRNVESKLSGEHEGEVETSAGDPEEPPTTDTA